MRHGDDMGSCNGNALYDDDTDENEIEDLSEEFEYKVRAKTLGTQSEVKFIIQQIPLAFFTDMVHFSHSSSPPILS